jgi:hypothetical protein
MALRLLEMLLQEKDGGEVSELLGEHEVLGHRAMKGTRIAIVLWATLLAPLIGLLLPLLFGALISPTDPIAVLGLMKSAGAPRQLEVQMAGESLFNDGLGVVIFMLLLQLAGLDGTHGAFPIAAPSRSRPSSTVRECGSAYASVQTAPGHAPKLQSHLAFPGYPSTGERGRRIDSSSSSVCRHVRSVGGEKPAATKDFRLAISPFGSRTKGA